MKIVLYSSGHVDLEAPINITQRQFDIFYKFFEDNFVDVGFIEKTELTKKPGSKEVDSKEWSLEEYALLLEPTSNADLADKMERTEMGVRMKRGHFVFDFLAWMKEKGYSLPVNREMIREFFGERG